MNSLLRLILLIWVSPNSILGLSVGCVGLITGGGVQLRRNCMEFHGGWIQWILKRLPPGGVMAMTLGHVIVGQTESDLAVARDHEHVHVSQYERWGPFFIPAYLVSSGCLWLAGRDFYRENPFEVEAYSVADPGDIWEGKDA